MCPASGTKMAERDDAHRTAAPSIAGVGMVMGSLSTQALCPSRGMGRKKGIKISSPKTSNIG